MQNHLVLAEITPREWWELAGLVALAMMMFAGWLRWQLSWLRSDVEEEMKDSKITPEQAARRVARLSAIIPLMMFSGAVLLVLAGLQIAKMV